MKLIQLANGKGFAQVDDADFALVSSFRWHKSKGYALHRLFVGGVRLGGVGMHTLLLDPAKGLEVDHVDGNGLNNQRANLRLATHAENLRNRHKSAGKSSRYKGVCFDKTTLSWKVSVCKDYQIYHLGRFKCEKEAALAYNRAAVGLFGKFARLNNLDEDLHL